MARLNKKEYIAKFGEEAWQTEVKRRSALNREYKEKHRKELAKKELDRYYANKDAISKKRKEYRQSHKEQLQQKAKEYYLDNKEYIKNKSKSYYQDNKNILKEKTYNRASGLLNSYKSNDKKYNREGFNLTQQFILDHIFSSTCIYCGESDWYKLGCDRIDNEKAHTTDNVVCACKSCNLKRGTTPFREFLLSQNPSAASDILSSLGLD